MSEILSIFILLFPLYLFSAPLEPIEEMISKMIIIGFDGTKIDKDSEIFDYPLGGVILFDKNIESKKQLINLTTTIKRYSKDKIFIFVDEEGGLVSRVGKIRGFKKIPSQEEIAKFTKKEAKEYYKLLADMLSLVGINGDFAPCVDLAVNPKNSVIVKAKRSFSKDPNVVIDYATIFTKELSKRGILSVIKHFPGHGSSFADSHKGFVDITKTWTKKELKPFQYLINKNIVHAVMVGHIFNKNIDKHYPASLSKFTNIKLLRDKIGFDGVIISDDLQMKAISDNYSLRDSLKLAINSSVDLLLFANQNSKKIKIGKIISLVKALIKNGEININMIKVANKRVDRLKRGIR